MSIRWVALLLVSSVVLGACGAATSQEATEAHADAWHGTTVRGEASSFGPFAVGTEVSFPDRRTLVEARFDLADSAGQEVHVVMRGAGDGPVDLPAVVDADRRLAIIATYGPDCERPAAPPALLVRTTGRGGDPRVDGFRSEVTAAFESAFDTYCSRGVTARVTGSEQSADGSFTVHLEVFNPGSSSMELTSPDHEVGDTHWFPVSATIGPVQVGAVVFEGEGNGCTADTPWGSGRLTADGQPVQVPEGAGEQC
jgi:hypothetical protein